MHSDTVSGKSFCIDLYDIEKVIFFEYYNFNLSHSLKDDTKNLNN